MGSSLHRYVPSTLRLVLDKFSIKALCHFGDYAHPIPPAELPGEVDWRADFLRWHISDIASRALLLPPFMRADFFEEEDERLGEADSFAPVEVTFVIDFARRTVGSFDGEVSRDVWAVIQGDLRRAKSDLARRHRIIFGASPE